jgi:MarR family transcriptional regulator for hemolysin
LLVYDFDQSLSYWITTTAHALERAIAEDLAPHGITFRQWQVIAWLAHDGILSQSELADRMKVEPPTLAGIIDRMERDGWIVRCECPGDRRKKLLKPTEKVAPVWETIANVARRVRARASRNFTPEQLESLKAMLGAIRENLGQDAPEDEPAPAALAPAEPG